MIRIRLIQHAARWRGHFLTVSLTLTLLQSTQAVDKSGVSPNTISLPSGPGSIEGLGEDFQPHLNTGTSSYRVPLRVPNGTAGHTPELALVYEGGSGNSCLGIGWSLSIPSVRRQCEKGLPRYEPNAKDDDFDGLTDEADEEDRFLDTQGEELLLTDRGYYFPEKQEQFIRWRKVDSHWKAEQPNGDVWEFGRSGDARVESQGRIYRWCLDRQEDTNGNVIEYKYTRFQDSPNENQTYLTEIRYGPGSPPWSAFYTIVFEYETRPDTIEDYRSGFVVRTGLRMRKIHMALQGTVNEAESIGSLDPNGHRIGDINQDGVKDALIRVYEFKYEAHPHWSLLTSITTVGADGVSTLPPATFAYQRFLLPSVVSANGSTILSENEPTSVMDTGHSDLVDLNGDGLPDILRTEIAGGGHTGYLNLGPALENHLLIRWDSGIELDATANSGQAWLLDLNSDQVHLADMDGDGLADLVSNPPQNQNPHYFRNTSKNGWGPRETMAVGDDIPPAPFGNPDVRTTDLNFDKNIDIVQSIPNGYRIWYNLGKDRETGIARYGERILTPGAIHEDTVIQFSESGTQLADLNGDRLSDVARIRPTSVIFCPSIGYGIFDSSTVVPIPTDNGLEHDTGFSFLDTEQIQRARLIDINGDGLADLVVERAAPREVWCWENLGNRSFAERRIITDLPANFGFMVETRWADINGNGTDDLIYADSNLENGERIRVVDIGMALNGVPCPNILSSIENGIGRRILIQHRPTTFFAALDRSEGNPWTHTVPNPTAVVHRIIVEDGLGHHYTTEIMYHEGYYDGVEKEFRGFARSEQLDFGDDSQPTLVSEHHFDVGDTAEALKGKTLRVVRKNTMGQVFDEEITEWSTRVLHTVSELPDSLLAPTQVTFPFPVVKRQIIREEPTGPSDPVILESEYAHDDYGNKVMEANYGRVEGGNRGAGDDERITRTVFSATPEARIWSAPVDTVVTDDSTPPRVVGRNQAYYDGPPHVGLPLGSITKGNLSRARDWVGPENPPNPPNPLSEPPERFLQVNTNPDNTLSLLVTDEDADHWIHTTRNQYDSFGNVLRVADPLAELNSKGLSPATGHFRNLTYDSTLHTFPTHEEIFTGNGNTLLIQVAYDLAFGTIIRSIDFNGFQTDYGYDVFSRVTAIAKPGGSPRDTLQMPTVEFSYTLAATVQLGANQGTANWIETRLHEEFGDPSAYFTSRKFIDGLGREILSKEEDEQPGRTVVKSAKTFNARRTEFQSILPFYSHSGLDFEWIEGPGWTGTWLIDGQEQVFDLDQAPRNRMFYDATGREIRMLQPDEAFTRTEYLPLVRRVLDEEDTNPASKHFDTPMVYHTDGLGRLVGVDEVVKINDDGTPRLDPVPWRTTYDYDLLDDLIRIKDSQNNIKTIQYDAIKRKTYMDDPDRGRMWYRYDDASNLIESVDAKGQRITYTYDGTNRLRTEDYHDEGMPHSANRVYNPPLPIGGSNQPDVAYHYDAPAPGGSIDLGDATFGTAENLLGFLSYVVDLSGEEHNSYDERGNVRWVVKRIPDPPTGIRVSYKTEMVYDAADRAVELIYPDNDRVTYTYNTRNLPESIPSILDHINYAPSSQTIEMLCGNGVLSGYKYDRRIRLSHLSHISTNQGNQPLVDYAYEFDGASNITAIHDLRPAEEVALDSERRNTQLFEYDSLYRLTQVKYPRQGKTPQIDYRYDRIGNMLYQASPPGPDHLSQIENGLDVVNHWSMAYGGAGGPTGREGRGPGAPAGPHALTSSLSGRNYEYDDNGNMTLIDGARTEWDFKDRMVGYHRDTIDATYVYDYTNRRIAKVVSDQTGTTHVLYPDKYFEVREFDTPTKYVWKGEQRIAKTAHMLDGSRESVRRLRLMEGWNLVTVGVAMADMSVPNVFGDALSVWGWDGEAHFELSAAATITPGSAYWVQKASSDIRFHRGTPISFAARTLPPGRHLLAWPGPEGFDLDSIEGDHFVWKFDAESQGWKMRTNIKGQQALNRLPPVVGPGTGFWVDTQDVEMDYGNYSPKNYYCQDHLGSLSITTNNSGETQAEVCLYPFGQERISTLFTGEPTYWQTPYGFSQKEQDKESSLLYFQSRLLLGSMSRFLSSDPMGLDVSLHWCLTPQRLNMYSYCINQPLIRVDPTGRSDKSANQSIGEDDNGYDSSAQTDKLIGEMIKDINQELQESEHTRGLRLEQSSNPETRERTPEQQAEIATRKDAKGNNVTWTCKSQHYEKSARDLLLTKNGKVMWNLKSLSKEARAVLQGAIDKAMRKHGVYNYRGGSQALINSKDPLHFQLKSTTTLGYGSAQVQTCLREYKRRVDSDPSKKNPSVDREAQLYLKD